MDFDGIRAAAVKARDETPGVGLHLPALFGEAGEGDRAGDEFQRAAVRIIDLRGGGQRERRHVAAKVAGELEIRERDVAGHDDGGG